MHRGLFLVSTAFPLLSITSFSNTSQGGSETWLRKKSTTMEALQKKLIFSLVRASVRYHGRSALHTDVYNVWLHSTILKVGEDKRNLWNGYMSSSLSNAERAYDTAHRECYAVSWSVLLIWPYFRKTRFATLTNHDYLYWIQNLSDISSILARW